MNTFPILAIDKAVGQWMRNARKRKRLSETSVAASIGVHRNTLNRWEKGLTQVPAWAYMAVCLVLEYEPRFSEVLAA